MTEHPRIPAIHVDLTDEQIDEIEPMLLKAHYAAEAGRPGFLCAHILNDTMMVFFIDHERALEFQELMGQEVGRTTKNPDHEW